MRSEVSFVADGGGGDRLLLILLMDLLIEPPLDRLRVSNAAFELGYIFPISGASSAEDKNRGCEAC